MRIWDVPPSSLCRQHLLGEHRELHAIWKILTHRLPKTQGYWSHPETQRWIGKLGALAKRHEQLVKEMEARGYNHKSPLPDEQYWTEIFPNRGQRKHIDSIGRQKALLTAKPCECSFPKSEWDGAGSDD